MTGQTIILRPAVPADAPALAALARQSFIDAFAHFYRPEDLQQFLDEWKTPEVYTRAIADPDTAIRLAEVDGELAAYALVKRGYVMDDHPHPRPQRPVFLSQLYCAGHLTGHGLGRQLMDWVLEQARDWQADSLSLSVYSENPGAQRFYQRYGFEKVADTEFWVGSQRDEEYLYELRL
ncbi:GNAT family N-acetyltransferase [Alteraurantiacibacter buctensis]|uniref:GNAT family N-acetyltransferase n=1 Tax=Alteraurantiacibacter buctensis TaxID=1503981 RepID=UPI00301D8E3E